MNDSINMQLFPRMIILSLISSVILFSLTIDAVSADHESGHYEIELEEEYYYPMILSYEDDTGVQLIISSSKDIDVLILTPEMYDACCSNG